MLVEPAQVKSSDLALVHKCMIGGYKLQVKVCKFILILQEVLEFGVDTYVPDTSYMSPCVLE